MSVADGIDARPSGGENWIYPAGLLLEERPLVGALLAPFPEIAQVLLDELAGRLARHEVRVSPIGYVRGMLERVQAGSFVPELAARVLAGRERTAREAVERARRRAELARESHRREDPAHRRAIDGHRAALRRLLATPHTSNAADPPASFYRPPAPSAGTVNSVNSDPAMSRANPAAEPDPDPDSRRAE